MSHTNYWICPYCGHDNRQEFPSVPCTALANCDLDEGGCGGLIVLTAKVQVIVAALRVEGEGKAEEATPSEPAPAAPIVNANPPTPWRKEAGQATSQTELEERIEAAWKELQTGDRRDLRGFRRDVSTPLLWRELSRVYSVYGRPFTQPEWDNMKFGWATEAIALVRNLDTTWTEIQMRLEKAPQSETILGTLSGA